ncbi:MAG TPA: hypothetical protein VNG12_11040 [Acidimicrobiales bacterium]|nr:hypothetical protein [Acidimicrobiales bacterium]
MAKADELQNAPAEEFWERFEAVMSGPDGLMTYRYLGTQADPRQEGGDGVMTIRRDMRNAAGGLMAAPLSIALADVNGIRGDAAGVPAPVMSSVHMVDGGLDVGAVRVHCDGAGHAGRTLSFSGTSVVVDAAMPDRVLAVTEGMGVQLASAPPGYRYVDPGPGVPDSPELPPLHVAFGATRIDGGWKLPELTQQIGSTSGSLHHGPIQIVLEAAAGELVGQKAGTDRLQIEDWTVSYVSRGKLGPFGTSGTVVEGQLGRFVARMRLVDEGNHGRLVATALAVFRRAD